MVPAKLGAAPVPGEENFPVGAPWRDRPLL